MQGCNRKMLAVEYRHECRVCSIAEPYIYKLTVMMTTQPAKNRNTPNSMAHSMLMKLCPIRNVKALHNIQQTGQFRKAARLSATLPSQAGMC